MNCTRPVHGYYAKRANRIEGGRPVRSVVFRQSDGFTDMPVTLPCGKCLGCRIEYARQWAVRCEHELRSWSDNCFITLTYEDKVVPYTASGLMTLSLDDVTKFWKRLRKHLGHKIRYFQCGEYGPTTLRPHYHAIVFNWWPADSVREGGKSKSGEDLYGSKTLSEIWGYGRVTVQGASYRNAAYVARYVTKKLVDPCDGSDDRVKEFITMSRRPGIGHNYAQAHIGEWFAQDALRCNDVSMRPPKYYESLCAERFPELLSFVKHQRIARAAEVEFERVTNSGVTHHSVEVVREAKLRTLTRDGIED